MSLKASTPSINKYYCVDIALRVVLIVPRRSANTNSNVCGVIVAVRAMGGSGGLVDGMSTEGSMTLGGRKRRTSRWYVLGREHGSGREESVNKQMKCSCKGVYLCAWGIGALDTFSRLLKTTWSELKRRRGGCSRDHAGTYMVWWWEGELRLGAVLSSWWWIAKNWVWIRWEYWRGKQWQQCWEKRNAQMKCALHRYVCIYKVKKRTKSVGGDCVWWCEMILRNKEFESIVAIAWVSYVETHRKELKYAYIIHGGRKNEACTKIERLHTRSSTQ